MGHLVPCSTCENIKVFVLEKTRSLQFSFTMSMKSTPTFHLAQINIATAKYPMEDPRMHGFVSRLDEINALAEGYDGFVWRLQDDSGNATNISISDDPMLIVNMSVWESPESLKNYVYKSVHVEVMRLRKHWFHLMKEAYYVLWWIPAGHIPTVEEAVEKLELLRAHGPTPAAFDFKKVFEPGITAI